MTLTQIQNKLAIPLNWIKPVFNLQYGYGSINWPNPLASRIQTFTDTPSLYMNGIIFFGIQFPFFVNFMIRFTRKYYLQTHIGWRPVDGMPVAVFRFQSDASAQAGLVSGYLDGAK